LRLRERERGRERERERETETEREEREKDREIFYLTNIPFYPHYSLVHAQYYCKHVCGTSYGGKIERGIDKQRERVL